MQFKKIVVAVALVGSALALPAPGTPSLPPSSSSSPLTSPVSEVAAHNGASLENVETLAWYGWLKRDAAANGASLENVETAAWYGWFKRALGLEKKGGASLENVETAAWYGWI